MLGIKEYTKNLLSFFTEPPKESTKAFEKYNELKRNKDNNVVLALYFRMTTKVAKKLELGSFEEKLYSVIRDLNSKQQIINLGFAFERILNSGLAINILPNYIVHKDLNYLYNTEEVYEILAKLPYFDYEHPYIENFEETPISRSYYGRKTIKADLIYMECLKNTGDQVFGPSDEIFWSFSIGSDNIYKKKYRSKEYGSQKDGKITYMEGNDAIPFTFDFFNEVSMVIQCWEADDSNSDFLDEMEKVCFKLAQECLNFSKEAALNKEKRSAGYLALASIAFALVGGLTRWARNDDDLIQERTIALNYEQLKQWNNTTQYWTFKGGNGHYRLYIKFSDLKEF